MLTLSGNVIFLLFTVAKELSLIMCNDCFQEMVLGRGVDEGPGWTQSVSDKSQQA